MAQLPLSLRRLLLVEDALPGNLIPLPQASTPEVPKTSSLQGRYSHAAESQSPLVDLASS